MNNLLEAYNVVAVVEWLYTYLLHSTILIAAVWVGCRFTPLKSIAASEQLWKVAAFGSVLTATLVSLNLVHSPIDSVVLGSTAAPGDIVNVQSSAHHSPYVTGIDNLLNQSVGHSLTSDGSGDLRESNESNATPVNLSPITATYDNTRSGVLAAKRTDGLWPPLLLSIWIAGIAFFGIRFLVSRSRFLDEIGPRTPVESESILNELEFLKAASGFTGDVLLTESFQLRSAVVIGRNEICVPTRIWAELSDCEQRSMLAHEFAHVIRRDPFWLQLFNVLCGILFMQPLNFVARKRYRELAEYSCDTWVIRTTGLDSPLASCLVKVAQWIRGGYAPAPFMGIGGSPLRQRVERILDGHDDKQSPVVFACGLVAVVTLGAFAPSVTLHDEQDVSAVASVSEYAKVDTVRITLHSNHRYEFVFEKRSSVVATGVGTITIDRSSRQILSISPGGFVVFDQRQNGRTAVRVTFDSDEYGDVRATYHENLASKDSNQDSHDEWLLSAIELFANAAETDNATTEHSRILARQLEAEARVAAIHDSYRQRLAQSQKEALSTDSVVAALYSRRNDDRVDALRNDLNRRLQLSATQLERYENSLKELNTTKPADIKRRIDAINELATESQAARRQELRSFIETTEQYRLELQAKKDAMRTEALEATTSALDELLNDTSLTPRERQAAQQRIEAMSNLAAQKKYASEIADVQSRLDVAQQLANVQKGRIDEVTSQYSDAVRQLESQLTQMRLETVDGVTTARQQERLLLEEKVRSLRSTIDQLALQLSSLNEKLEQYN